MTARGFTLIELMVAISIIAVLATIGFASYRQAQSSARDSKRISDLQEISKAIEQYKALNNTYSIATTFPCNNGSWWDFSNGTWGTQGSQVGCPASIINGLKSYFSATIPNDPFCPNAACAGTWHNYVLSQPTSDGSSYILYTELEKAPTNNNCPSGVTPPPPYNYCQPSLQ